jgi:hypothetical protein
MERMLLLLLRPVNKVEYYYAFIRVVKLEHVHA